MKFILSFIAFNVVLQNSSESQIIVDPYEKQIRINVNDIASLPMPRASSKEGEVKTVYSDQTFSGGCLGTLVRTFEFSDAQGNKASAELYINLEDTDGPIFANVPSDVIVAGNTLPVVTSPLVTDNSNTNSVVTFSENKEGNIVTRIWVAMDVCGNQSIVSQRITLKEK